MTAKKDFLGLVDPGREIRRPPLVGMQSLHQGAVRTSDVLGTRAGLKAKNLISLIWRHCTAARRTPLPRCRVVLRVLAPTGRPAVEISCQ